MRTTGKRKRRREVPSSGRGKRTRQVGQPSPVAGGGGGARAARGTQGVDAHLPDPVAADLQAASPVAPPPGFLAAEIGPPPGLLMFGSYQIHAPDGSPSPSAPGSAPNLGPSSRSDSPSRKSRIREKRSPPHGNVARNSSPPSSSSSTASYQTVAGKKSAGKKHRDVADLLRNYLKGNGTSLVDEMWEQEKFHLSIDFFALRRVNKKAADKICNQRSKGMQAAMSDAAQEVVLELFKKKEYTRRFSDEDTMVTTVLHNFELQFVNLPRSISSLESTIANLRGNALRSLFKGHAFTRKVVEMNEALRRLLDSCFHQLLLAHRHDRSWNGQWVIDDWVCINEEIFYFEGAPTVYDDSEELLAACKADLQKFATAIVSRFAIRGDYPAYLHHLFNELNNEVQTMTLEDYFGSEEERDSWAYFSGCGWYMDFLEFHPALMTAVARLGLIEGWYVCINDLQYEKLAEFSSTICRSLIWTNSYRGKTEKEVDRILWLTFWHNADKPIVGGDSSTWKPQYSDTWAQKLLFLRQLCYHTYRHTKIAGGIQSITEEDEPELNAAKEQPGFLPDFIKLLLSRRKMTGGFFRYWDAYRKQR